MSPPFSLQKLSHPTYHLADASPGPRMLSQSIEWHSKGEKMIIAVREQALFFQST